MAITAVGSLATSLTNILSTSGVATLSVSPVTQGDLLVFFGGVNSVNSGNATSVSGGGVTTWHQVIDDDYSSQYYLDIWYGVVTSTGSSTITVDAPFGGASAINYICDAQEFSGGSGTWGVDTSGQANAGNATTSGNFPSLTPAGANELYLGAALSSRALSGSTSGFTYVAGYQSGTFTEMVYNLAASSPTAQSPAWSVTGTGDAKAIGAVLFTFAPAFLPKRPQGLPAAVRRANNYFKRENGLWEPERGLIVPRVA